MITARALTKTYGETTAVDGLDFAVRPGVVTGFLGPAGAGKSTTMRLVIGLDRPTSGEVRVNGQRYAATPAPLREVGALPEARSVRPGRSALGHLRWLAATNGIPRSRVDAVLEQVGLGDVAERRVGRVSLGMGRRLGIAAALLGDPPVVVLDEPVNGLDPEGIRWVRTLARQLAAEGRTVLVSGHLMSEMALTADHLLVIGRGRLLADCSTAQFVSEHAASYVRVRGPQPQELARVLQERGLAVTSYDGALRVDGRDAAAVGEAAAAAGLTLHELTVVGSSLEEAFMTLTANRVEVHASRGAAA